VLSLAAQGADAPLSGLLAMLAAVHLLDQAQQWGFYSRRLVFLALVGEPWDYMGSRRLLWEIKNGSVTVAGLDPAKIDQVGGWWCW
jgi:nicastrin